MFFLNEGEKVEVKGSGKNPYLIKKVGGVVSCSCPAWRNLGGPIDNRVCKHIRANIDPACLLPQAVSALKGTASKATPSSPRLTKGGKVSTAVGGAVVKDTAPPVLLAHKWENEDVTGFWMSEKLDGVRAWWDGEKFLSRLGNTYYAPEWFKKLLPNEVLDGELFVGRGKFQQTVSTVRKLIPDDQEWKAITFVVFDAPEKKVPFEERVQHLRSLFPNFGLSTAHRAVVLEQKLCKGAEDLALHLKEVERLGGEGIMLREAKSLYEEGRSKTLLKVKSFFDDEAEVIDHEAGRGKHKGRMGAVRVRWNGVEFKVGTGFTDEQRCNPPKIGSKITFRYQELTNDGVPRFPSFVAIRDYD